MIIVRVMYNLNNDALELSGDSAIASCGTPRVSVVFGWHGFRVFEYSVASELGCAWPFPAGKLVPVRAPGGGRALRCESHHLLLRVVQKRVFYSVL